MAHIDRFGGKILLLLAAILGCVGAFDEIFGLETYANRTGRYQRNRVTKTGLNENSCTTQSGYLGTCMTRFNCMRNGGVISGYCATYGVCCETNMACGRVSSLKRTLIQTPTTLTSRCTYTFEPYSSRVCQLKIEFEEFVLPQPTIVSNGVADTYSCVDSLTVNNLILCGVNSGQHIYVEFDVYGGGDSNVNLIFNLPTQDAVSRWRMIVTQLECPTATTRRGLLPFTKTAGMQDLKNLFVAQNNDLAMLAPRGCTQYFTDRTGTVTSFNYNSGGTTTGTVGPYMPSMNYAICFQRLAGDSAVQLRFGSFYLPNENTNLGYDSDCHSVIDTPFKDEDYLTIPEAVVQNPVYGTLTPTLFCGTSSQGTTALYGAPGPFVIYFQSDEYYSTDDRGFQITYTII